MSKRTPDSLKGAKSPFLENLVIPMYLHTDVEETIKVGDIKVSNNTVTSLGNAVSKTTKYYPREKDRNIHLYHENNGEDLRPVFAALSKEGRMMLDYIMLYCLRRDKLLFYIETQDFMDKYMVKSRTTVWNSKKDLINMGFIAPTSCQNWYWVNPKFIFKGLRSKIKELEGNLKYYNKE